MSVCVGDAIAQTSVATADAQATDTKGETAKPLPTINYHVLEGWKLNLGNRSIYYNRVAPPVLPTPPPAPLRQATRSALPEELFRRPEKKFEVLFLSTTVYDHRVTEVRWYHGQREIRAYSNIDFNHLCGLGEFETEDTVYMLLMGIGNETAESVEAFNQYAAEHGWPRSSWKQIPDAAQFSPTRAEYLLAETKSDTPVPAESLASLDALHTYYNANRTRLAEEYVTREAQRVEQERWLKAHPPVPKDTVINFWPKKNSVYLPR